jgi:hypothetical protein
MQPISYSTSVYYTHNKPPQAPRGQTRRLVQKKDDRIGVDDDFNPIRHVIKIIKPSSLTPPHVNKWLEEAALLARQPKHVDSDLENDEDLLRVARKTQQAFPPKEKTAGDEDMRDGVTTGKPLAPQHSDNDWEDDEDLLQIVEKPQQESPPKEKTAGDRDMIDGVTTGKPLAPQHSDNDWEDDEDLLQIVEKPKQASPPKEKPVDDEDMIDGETLGTGTTVTGKPATPPIDIPNRSKSRVAYTVKSIF